MPRARAGFAGKPATLDGGPGFFQVLGLGGGVPERCVAGRGTPWEIPSTGLACRACPCCGENHLPAEVLLDLVARHAKADDVEERLVTFPPGGEAALMGCRTPAEAPGLPRG
ncbi:hypothetical protein ACFFGY_01565 [Roseomonas elaeocarpi]|uniref:Uncharacterized protein n=1 Tax=Roseomonas elaeocarpi TaxID=907779 RepID=A0ABV6JMH1_9PROT